MKRIIALFASLIVFAMAIPSYAVSIEEQSEVLYNLGLLRGVGNEFKIEDMELERNATRAEACITIVRMLGKEEKAKWQKNPHPFKDVPAWASDSIGWLYENYLVNGISDTYFGSADIATAGQFSTMLLRVLGYDDSEGDFSYSEAVQFAKGKGLVDSVTESHWELSREDMVKMCYKALSTPCKNSRRTLIRKLCDEKAIEESVAVGVGLLKEISIDDNFSDVKNTLGEIEAQWHGKRLVITFENKVEHYGIRMFMRSVDGNTVTEIPYEGDVYFEKGEKSYRKNDPASYIEDLYVYGLEREGEYELIVIKTTSEDEFYKIVGKSKPVTVTEED